MIREKSSSETHIDCQKLCEKCERSNMPSSDVTIDHSSSVTIKPEEKEISNNPWITGGPPGSRDAVLVFRTSLLNVSNDMATSTATLDSGTTSLSNVAKDGINNHNNSDNTKNQLQLQDNTAKVLLSLPRYSSSPSWIQNLNEKISCIEQYGVKKKEIIQIKSPKKRLRDSLSSSDNSISSECDNDPHDIETEYLNATKRDLMRNSSGDFRKCPKLCKHQPEPSTSDNQFSDNKENIGNSATLDIEMPNVSDMPAAKLNLTYKFMNTETRLLKKIFTRHGLSEAESEQNFSILWTGAHLKPDVLRNLTPYQRVNHFPRSYELTRKDRLYKNIEKMQHLRGFKHFDIVPESFVLPLEYRDLVSAHNKHRGPWIVKPIASSRGRGIFIVNSPDQIPAEEQVLVSKYVSDPLCIDGHKCDLRVYVMVTSFDPLIIYIYEEGLVRLATVKYEKNVENLWNPCMHLCNYSINKYHSDYIKSSDFNDEDVGHKWTLSALLRHLKLQGCDTSQLLLNIEDLITKALFACAQSIISACRMFVPTGNNCFELYGFDILIDDTLKPWLLEINLSPSMGVDSPLDTKVKASLMTDLLTLIGIPAYNSVQRTYYDTKWSRYRNVSFGTRRTNSADPLSKRGIPANVPLTSEEMKICRNLKLQNSRRGGFVRIFPTEESLSKYGSFLDPISGIPISTTPTGQSAYSTTLPHNYNQVIFNYFYGKDAKDKSIQDNFFPARLQQYERALDKSANIIFGPAKKTPAKCIEEGKRLKNKIRKLIENGSELTQLQARQTFSSYLEAVLRRLTQEPKCLHEKIILKFIHRIGSSSASSFRAPPPAFLRNPFNINSKDRSAMVAKLLGDYLESYGRDTEAYIDTFDNYGMIPISLFNEFLAQAHESDLESILTLHTNSTRSMPFLYNRCSAIITPPIPQGIHGFLKALPTMVPCRDNYKLDNSNKNNSNSSTELSSKNHPDIVEKKNFTTIDKSTDGNGLQQPHYSNAKHLPQKKKKNLSVKK